MDPILSELAPKENRLLALVESVRIKDQENFRLILNRSEDETIASGYITYLDTFGNSHREKVSYRIPGIPSHIAKQILDGSIEIEREP